tara:strand:- start:630 stop:1136 length:507 start_codon:yes stop_codon:yes gene_type:complete
MVKRKVNRKSKKLTKKDSYMNIDSLLAPLESLNNSKYFAGLMLILVNLGSKYVSLELSKTQEAYLKYTIGRQILLFSILWMGTRDIIISLVLTAVFVIMASYLFNENSKYCIIPDSYKKLESILDTDGDGVVSEKEIDDALQILKKAKIQKNNGNGINNEELMREQFL